MKRMIFGLAVLAAAVAGSAAARTTAPAAYTVLAGEPAPLAGAPKGTTLNGFFPAKLAVHEGDSITFKSSSFHTVAYLPDGKLPPLVMPTSAKFDGIVGADSQPFWFNGQAVLAYNPAVFGPIPGKDVVAGKPIASGVLTPAGPKAPPASVTWSFPKAGSFTFYCTVHGPLMKVKVDVKPASAAIPSPTQVDSTALAAITASGAEAAKTTAVTPPANTVLMGPGTGNTTRLSYEPATLTVKAGTTVTFKEVARTEVHNVAFGPKAWIQAFQKKNDLLPTGPGSKNQFSPIMVYGSEAPGPINYDGKNHGNGFLSTPLNDNAPGNPPQGLAGSAQVTFTKAGTYKYFCLIHGPDMSGTIVVTP
jgi:plastocyanin